MKYMQYRVFTSQMVEGKHDAPLPVCATGSENRSILIDFFSVLFIVVLQTQCNRRGLWLFWNKKR